MKIVNARTTIVRLPRTDTLKTSYGSGDFATTIIVELFTDEGTVGVGQTAVAPRSYGETAEGISANIQTHLIPEVIGETPFDIERINQKLQAALPHHWSSHAGVELALWDLKGKALGVPVYQLLGGKVRDGVDLMGFVHLDTPETMARQAVRTLDTHGFTVLKMKIGLDPKQDLQRYKAVAEAVAGRAVIQVDGNTGYTITQALPTLYEMQTIGSLGAIEQPVAKLSEMADIARRLHTPVMADEAIYPPEDAIDVVKTGAASLALMKMNKHGGLENVHRIGMIFEAAGLSLSIAIYYDLIAVAAAHLAAALPCVHWPSPATDLQDTILSEPFEADGLLLRVPDAPGLGVELDWEKVARYTVTS